MQQALVLHVQVTITKFLHGGFAVFLTIKYNVELESSSDCALQACLLYLLTITSGKNYPPISSCYSNTNWYPVFPKISAYI